MPIDGPIPSPYYHIPRNDRVVLIDPDDAARINHDVPFSDGICGSFTVELEATTDIFTTGSSPGRPADEENPVKEFFRVLPNGKFAINGTGLKGVVSSILGVAAFGKLNRVENRRFAVRDLYDPAYQTQVTNSFNSCFDKTLIYEPKAKAGWLRIRDDGNWTLERCDFARIEQTDLEAYALKHFERTLNLGLTGPSSGKYARWDEASGGNRDLQVFIQREPGIHQHSRSRLVYRKAFLDSVIQAIPATARLVLTGQPNQRQPGRNGRKHLEFLFLTIPTHPPSTEPILIRTEVRQEFEALHDADDGDWISFWKPRLLDHRHPEPVPVFYLGTETEVNAIGLALMPRLPSRFSLHDALGPAGAHHLSSQLDLVESIFGCSRKSRELRGRISFLPLLHVQKEEPSSLPMAIKEVVLRSPKPSFYLGYLQQPISEDPSKCGRLLSSPTTYLSNAGLLSGRKFYPPRSEPFQPVSSPPRKAAKPQTVRFVPLPAGQCFRGEVFVHNLRPFELGALIWALTLGELPNAGRPRLRLRIGMAKPHGYGSMKVAITAPRLVDPAGKRVQLECCVSTFIDWVKRRVPDWESSPQIQELLEASDPNHDVPDEQFQYPVLSPTERINEFRDAKPNKEFRFPGLGLLPFSRLKDRFDSARRTAPPTPLPQSADRPEMASPSGALSMMASSGPTLGDILCGTVSGVLPFGVFVEFAPIGSGLVHVSQIPADLATNLQRSFPIGSRLRVRVCRVRSDGKLVLVLVDRPVSA
ncbi:MAG: S1 RNA-binding domain-containing protein [Verrucomicrobiales bacterium]|nr:S1 RNA-binding domain-containing protein [Verrucomicrobiales bacterium]